MVLMVCCLAVFVIGVQSYHNGSEVLALEATDGVVQRLVHRC